MTESDEHRFVATLYELPSNYLHIMNVALDVPESVSDAFGMRGHVPVVGTADGANLTATLVPVGGDRHRLFLLSWGREHPQQIESSLASHP